MKTFLSFYKAEFEKVRNITLQEKDNIKLIFLGKVNIENWDEKKKYTTGDSLIRSGKENEVPHYGAVNTMN